MEQNKLSLPTVGTETDQISMQYICGGNRSQNLKIAGAVIGLLGAGMSTWGGVRLIGGVASATGQFRDGTGFEEIEVGEDGETRQRVTQYARRRTQVPAAVMGAGFATALGGLFMIFMNLD
ncbi:MAG: hypothetical protein FWB72_03610 [Firmicutes bacterium]|nr:hypothetical protein [Bacillota bacterium]